MNGARIKRSLELRAAGKQAHAEGRDFRDPPAGIDGNERAYWLLGWWDAEREDNAAA